MKRYRDGSIYPLGISIYHAEAMTQASDVVHDGACLAAENPGKCLMCARACSCESGQSSLSAFAWSQELHAVAEKQSSETEQCKLGQMQTNIGLSSTIFMLNLNPNMYPLAWLLLLKGLLTQMVENFDTPSCHEDHYANFKSHHIQVEYYRTLSRRRYSEISFSVPSIKLVHLFAPSFLS
jgi:hypothetical protein